MIKIVKRPGSKLLAIYLVICDRWYLLGETSADKETAMKEAKESLIKKMWDIPVEYEEY